MSSKVDMLARATHGIFSSSIITPGTGQSHRNLAKQNLRQLIAECETFQDAIGATGEVAEKIASALLRIYISAYKVETFVRPFALITSMNSDKADGDTTTDYNLGGELELRLEQDIAAEFIDDPEGAETQFEAFDEAVLAEAMVLSAQPGYFVMKDYHIIEGPSQYEIKNGVYVYGVRLAISWGLD